MTTSVQPAHAKQWTGPGPLELNKAEPGKPALVAYPGDYVLSFGGGQRQVLSQHDYEAHYGKPELSEYWATKTQEELALAAAHEVQTGGYRHG